MGRRTCYEEIHTPPASLERHIETIERLAEEAARAERPEFRKHRNIRCATCDTAWCSAAPDFWVGRPCVRDGCGGTISVVLAVAATPVVASEPPPRFWYASPSQRKRLTRQWAELEADVERGGAS